MATYNVSNFINDPSEGDRLMYIYNTLGQLTMTIDPYSSTFMNKSKYVYIITDGRMNYDNVLNFSDNDESNQAVARLNDVKKIFIDRTNNALNSTCGGGFVTISEFESHTANTNLHITANERASLNVTNNLSVTNTFATLLDINLYGDSNYVKISGDTMTGNLLMSADIIPTSDGDRSLGSYDYQWKELWVSGGTIYFDRIPLSTDGTNLLFNGSLIYGVSSLDDLTDTTLNNPTQDQILVYSGGTWINSVNNAVTDLSNYYTKSETNNNFLSANTNLDFSGDFLSASTTIGDLSGYTQQEVDARIISASTGVTYDDFNNHTGDTSIHFTKSSIILNDLGDVDTGGTLNNYYLTYSGGTWKGELLDLSNYSKLNVKEYNLGVGNSALDWFVSTLTDACHWKYVIKNGNIVESGTIISVWNSNNVTHTQYSVDVIGGNADDVTFYVEIVSNVVRLMVKIDSGTWNIKIKRFNFLD